jgi:hypothetical protein
VVSPLTNRGLTVLRRPQGTLSHVEIAALVYISVHTVKTHVKNIYDKLSANRLLGVRRSHPPATDDGPGAAAPRSPRSRRGRQRFREDADIVTIAQSRQFRQPANAPARRGDPVAEFEQLQDQMDQIINAFLRDPPARAPRCGSPAR